MFFEIHPAYRMFMASKTFLLLVYQAPNFEPLADLVSEKQTIVIVYINYFFPIKTIAVLFDLFMSGLHAILLAEPPKSGGRFCQDGNFLQSYD